MRFLLVDRVLRLEPGEEILALKNVCQSEDVFADHFPGRPIMPGSLIVETCDQASRLLLGESTGFAGLPVLEQVLNGKFRRFVQPGDQLQVRVVVVSRTSESAEVRATVSVDERPVAQVSLAYRIVEAARDSGVAQSCACMRDFFGVLSAAPHVEAAANQAGAASRGQEAKGV